jgi:hypothetical protein
MDLNIISADELRACSSVGISGQKVTILLLDDNDTY